MDSEFVHVLFSGNSNFILHRPAFLAKVFVQQCGKLDWGTKFIVVALFFIPIILLTRATRTHWQQGLIAQGWQCSARDGEGREQLFVVVEHQVGCYLHNLVTFNEGLASAGVYVQWQMHLPSNGKNVFIGACMLPGQHIISDCGQNRERTDKNQSR